MPLTAEALSQIVAAGCPACRRNHLAVRALVGGELTVLDGEPVSRVEWTYEREHFAERVYRVDCTECRHVIYEGADCPRCGARGAVGRAVEGRHGLPPLAACPDCGHGELTLTVEARMHALYVLGHASRRVLDAEAHEPGFHVVSAHCEPCDRAVAEVSGRCPACGRSSLVRTRG